MTNISSDRDLYRLGVQYEELNGEKGLRVCYASETEDCGIILYDRDTQKEIGRYPFSTDNRIGNVYYQQIMGIDPKEISYLFYEGRGKDGKKEPSYPMSEKLLDGKEKYVKYVPDRYARAFAGKDVFAEAKEDSDYKAVLATDTYDWEEDRVLQIPMEDCIVYCMHVRGFTMHASSGVEAKGTFQGIVEKIPYLKDLGITTLELQPAYEFNEMHKYPDRLYASAPLKNKEPHINYWGYEEGFYYTPKRSYAYGKDACTELKDMIKHLHENGMEVVMQFYFPDHISPLQVPDILRFWHIEYHVDGFHIKGNHLPVEELARDPYLTACKLWYYDFPVDHIYAGRKPFYKNLGFYNDTFRNNIRRLLKGEEGVLYEAFKSMYLNPSTHGMINYLTNYEGFTMADLFSYERKHNEANGENNRDGQDYNYSSNCGIEGESQNQEILNLRNRQIRNGFAFLMLSQGTPLIFMGDEFANSQKGNNNPYCQDNEIAWLNWDDLKKQRALFEDVKKMIAFRKKNRLFHMSAEFLLVDYKACGYPDLSFHGSEAWKPQWEPYSRHAGFMLCGDYLEETKESFYYTAINMHSECHDFALPDLPKGLRWKCIYSTDSREALRPQEDCKKVGSESRMKTGAEDIFYVKPKTIAVFCAEK